ncbi:MAG: carbohydrate-binding domain-containing protein [Paludibacteraceae bacterium]|nr:carbohydrate-binding domain-containing protein [Paludibacteraceae bacterium]
MIKRNMLLASAMFCTIAAFAGTEMSVYQGSDVSVRVVNPEAKMKFGGGKITFGEEEFTTSKVDSIILKHYVSVVFDGDKVTVSNPFDSVDVKVDGTTVEINSEFVGREIKYRFTGKSTNGNVIFSSKYKSEFELDGLDLTSTGVNPPIYVLTKKNTEVRLIGKNALKNSAKDTVGATMRGRGQFEFKGDGSLEVTSVVGHGIQSSDYVEVKNGKITINAASDGIHVNDYYLQSGGEVTVNCNADGVDVGEGYAEINGGSLTVKSDAVDSRGIRCTFEEGKENNADININGGKIDIQLGGDGARGFKADGAVKIDGGDILIVLSGKAYDDGTEFNYPCGIKADKTITVESGNVVVICQSTAASSRCAQADLSIDFNGGVTTLYQNSVGRVSGAKKTNVVKSDGNLTVKKVGNLYVFSDPEEIKSYNVTAVVVGDHECDFDYDSNGYDIDDYIMVVPENWESYEKYVK